MRTALIVGAGSGLSAALARAFAGEGMRVALAARNVGKLDGLVAELGALSFACDVAEASQVERLFEAVDAALSPPELVVFNASYRTRGAITELSPADVEKALAVGAYGAFLVAQEAARRMLAAGSGTLLFTGASASVKGYARSAPFAMAKFALRGLAQALARELQPQNIHVAHVVIDGGIASAARQASADHPDSLLDPDAIAAAYLHLARQPRSAWTSEIELRPWVEAF
jgi:NAD(P)-dependent dehydrogenase (short-subunit alcohol dehydrogenase family)